jgi:hypothetical protein
VFGEQLPEVLEALGCCLAHLPRVLRAKGEHTALDAKTLDVVRGAAHRVGIADLAASGLHVAEVEDDA